VNIEPVTILVDSVTSAVLYHVTIRSLHPLSQTRQHRPVAVSYNNDFSAEFWQNVYTGQDLSVYYSCEWRVKCCLSLCRSQSSR